MDIFLFWGSISPEKLMRTFWYFFVFDLGRYLIVDVIILLAFRFYKYSNVKEIGKARRRIAAETPLVTVISPGRNEGKHIPRLVEELKAQTYRRLEIIIIDDGSDDDTPQICRDLLGRGLIDRFFRNDIRGGKASAANLGLRYASGEFVVHIDADSHLHREAIEELLVPFYMDSKVGAVAGDVRVSNLTESLASSLQGIEYMKSISVGRQVASFLGILRIVSGAFGAFRKELLDRVGGWDVGPGLDGDVTLKIRKLGYKVAFEPYAVCFTNAPVTFRQLARQRYRWDRSLVRFRLRKHKDLLLPTTGFGLINFITVFDNIFFNLVLNVLWWVYILDMAINYASLLYYVVPMNYLLYLTSNVLQFAIALALTPHRSVTLSEAVLAIYLPLMPLYVALYLRTVRTYSYFMEFFFRKSYEDPWNPWKVSKVAKEKGL
ncbi:MAG: glycosyltransferase family 2 protein [Nitrospirales bacterium]|nr:glycosyltransferase family 2 protein [Nitrospirales bacterium]